MKTYLVHRVVSIRSVNTKFGERCIAELEIKNSPKKEYWMSLKQGNRLGECADRLRDMHSTKHSELHIVVDDSGDKERFVWCGIHSHKHSDIPFLEEKFQVKVNESYIGFADPEIPEVIDHLKDN